MKSAQLFPCGNGIENSWVSADTTTIYLWNIRTPNIPETWRLTQIERLKISDQRCEIDGELWMQHCNVFLCFVFCVVFQHHGTFNDLRTFATKAPCWWAHWQDWHLLASELGARYVWKHIYTRHCHMVTSAVLQDVRVKICETFIVGSNILFYKLENMLYLYCIRLMFLYTLTLFICHVIVLLFVLPFFLFAYCLLYPLLLYTFYNVNKSAQCC